MSRQLKKRYCECGRELEYRKRLCSECRQINIDIAHDRYNASKEHKERANKYYHEVAKHKNFTLIKLRRMRNENRSRESGVEI